MQEWNANASSWVSGNMGTCDFSGVSCKGPYPRVLGKSGRSPLKVSSNASGLCRAASIIRSGVASSVVKPSVLGRGSSPIWALKPPRSVHGTRCGSRGNGSALRVKPSSFSGDVFGVGSARWPDGPHQSGVAHGFSLIAVSGVGVVEDEVKTEGNAENSRTP